MRFPLNTTTTTRDYGGQPMEEASIEASPEGDENTQSTDGSETDATDELEISLLPQSPVLNDDNAVAYVTPENAEKEPESPAEKEPESPAEKEPEPTEDNV
uniref:Uncharacterized protein n=1 Tax=Knipowitschia caucasica TaxID=637954 RepID=A0AAV2KJ86_KNICA